MNTDGPQFSQGDVDAYGHLTWAVGWAPTTDDDNRGDWLACVDAVRSDCGNFVSYHVVVNSDSGGFIDTLESGILTTSDARKQLPGLLGYWLDIASKHISGQGEWFTEEETAKNLEAIKNWRAHVEEVIAE